MLSKVVKFMKMGWPSRRNEEDILLFFRQREELSDKFLVGIMSSYSQPRQGSSGEKAAWRASRNCLHESPGKELRMVARYLNRAEETRTQLLTVPAVKKRTSTSPITPMGVAKRTLGLPTSRLGRTIPGEDVSSGGRHSYQVVGGSANVIHHSGSNSGEAAAHLCS